MLIRFYNYLWVIFCGAALLLWLVGAFTMLTAVVFGFTAFGLIFMGMICVLPTNVHREVAPREAAPQPPVEAMVKRPSLLSSTVHAPMKLRTH